MLQLFEICAIAVAIAPLPCSETLVGGGWSLVRRRRRRRHLRGYQTRLDN